jgi:hypothetical protein
MMATRSNNHKNSTASQSADKQCRMEGRRERNPGDVIAFNNEVDQVHFLRNFADFNEYMIDFRSRIFHFNGSINSESCQKQPFRRHSN